MIPAGTYRANENGKLDISGIFNGYYYKDGMIIKGAGIVISKGSIYFVRTDGSVFTSGKLDVKTAKTNGLIEAGTYSFDDTGKLIR